MNVYQKLNKCREDLQQFEIKKSGKNKFVGFDYFELSDFLPIINKLNQKHGLISIVRFDADYAMLEIINAENPEEKILFTSPMGSASLKGCHEVQNIGATETYQRRYLYMIAYEIVEHDILDSSDFKSETSIEKLKIFDKIKETIIAASSEKELDYVKQLIRENNNHLSQAEINGLIGLGKQRREDIKNDKN